MGGGRRVSQTLDTSERKTKKRGKKKKKRLGEQRCDKVAFHRLPCGLKPAHFISHMGDNKQRARSVSSDWKNEVLSSNLLPHIIHNFDTPLLSLHTISRPALQSLSLLPRRNAMELNLTAGWRLHSQVTTFMCSRHYCSTTFSPDATAFLFKLTDRGKKKTLHKHCYYIVISR